MSLNREERRAWVKNLGIHKLRPDRPTMAQEDFFEICLQPKEALMYYQFHCAEWVRQNLCKEGKDSDGDARWIVDYDRFPFELGVIRLNWSLSDKKLTKALKKWLAENRPEGIKERKHVSKSFHFLIFTSFSLLRCLRTTNGYWVCYDMEGMRLCP